MSKNYLKLKNRNDNMIKDMYLRKDFQLIFDGHKYT